ncbi:MAG: DUF3696 domain-containing protein [Desulfobacteraceae bacterium]|nr:DUF3696 domain-containing protein [Desulfobacteraceae bacterium]
MPIHRISLKNFKCFKETDVELSRITVLTGETDSGKSSLIYGILAPFQSNGFPFYMSPNGKYVNMGDFKEISFKNLGNRNIEIDIAASYSDRTINNFKTIWSCNPSNNMPELNFLKITTDGIWENDKEKIYCEISTISDHKYKVFYMDELKENFEFDELRDMLKSDRKGFFSFIHNLEEFWINFISPFRLAPERTYYQKVKADEKVGINGEGYIDQISEWEHQKVPEFKKLISILKKLELTHSLKTRQLNGGRFELNVKTKSKSIWASLADVGFGISQFLPVIVADLQLANNSTLLLAQPEIHLHPSIQASLADYFVNQIKEIGKQYIIETHSEYLLNRLRLDIVKGILDPADISVYYFEPSPDGSITYRIEFTKDGQIKNAPKGFFDTYMIDTMDIALHA